MTGEPHRPDQATGSNAHHVKVAPVQPRAVTHVDDDSVMPVALYLLCFLAFIVGIVTGLGAVVFRGLIGLVHNVFFLGHLSFAYDASHFTPAAPWGMFVILVPVVGGFAVTWIVSTFAPEAKGHGVPEVMDAIYYKRGVIRPVVAVVKSIASAMAIGSGAAVGREGPIIQIGSALGSTLGQLVTMTAGQRITLVAAGAGAGIAATFNTPIGGVLFATELMMPEISVNTFLPVAIATGTATFLGRLFFGDAPAFFVPAQLGAIPNQPGSALTLILYALLGVLTGAAAALLIRALHWAEDGFDRVPGRYGRHAFGMLIVGVTMYLLWRYAGHYEHGVHQPSKYAIHREGGPTLGAHFHEWPTQTHSQATQTQSDRSLRYEIGLAGFKFRFLKPPPLLRRRCRLRDYSGHAVRTTAGWCLPAVAGAVQDAGYIGQSGVGFVGWRFFSIAFYRCNAGGVICVRSCRGVARGTRQRARLCNGGHGRNGGWRYRCCDDGGRDGLRDDARLRHRAAHDYRRGFQPGCTSATVARKHLHTQTCTTRTPDSQRPSCQHVPCTERGTGHGN